MLRIRGWGGLNRALTRALPALAVAAAIGMLVVLVMGATVTSTGSAEGCGRDWPLCHGRFIPDFAVATAIEFSHRFVTGIEGLLIVVVAVLCWLLHWDRGPIRVLTPLMLGSLILQAGMGAWAVKYPQAPIVLALHFGISLLALSSAAAMALYLRGLDRPARAPVGRAMVWGAWSITAYLYVLVYSGAYIRHVAAAAACTTWPLCTRGVDLGGWALTIDYGHRLLAALAVVLAIGLAVAAPRIAPSRPDLRAGAWWLVAALAAQAAAGASLPLSSFSLASELGHAGITGLVFIAAAYLCLEVTVPRSEPSASVRRPALAGTPS